MTLADPIAQRELLDRLVLVAVYALDAEIEDLIGPQRKRDVETVYIRRIITYVARRLGASFPQIGKILEQDHTTIMHGMQWIGRLPLDHPFFERCNAIYKALMEDDNG